MREVVQLTLVVLILMLITLTIGDMLRSGATSSVVVRWGKKEYDAVVLEVKSRAAKPFLVQFATDNACAWVAPGTSAERGSAGTCAVIIDSPPRSSSPLEPPPPLSGAAPVVARRRQ